MMIMQECLSHCKGIFLDYGEIWNNGIVCLMEALGVFWCSRTTFVWCQWILDEMIKFV